MKIHSDVIINRDLHSEDMTVQKNENLYRKVN